MEIEIRNESAGDFAKIHKVTELAFRNAPHPDHTEQFIVEALRRAAAGCVVLGYPGYYGRFGFKVVEGLRFPSVAVEYFQAKTFSGWFPKGEVVYHEAFSAQG